MQRRHVSHSSLGSRTGGPCWQTRSTFQRRPPLASPSGLVGPGLAQRLAHISEVFPDASVGVNSIKISGNDRSEYVKLIVRMLNIGKMRLRTKPRGVGAVFAVPKPGKDTVRFIWHGGVISERCERPPAPRRLGNPACFLDIQVKPGERFWMSKRDACSFFNVLQAPEDAQKWFCGPPLDASELGTALGCSLAGLGAYLADRDAVFTRTVMFLIKCARSGCFHIVRM